MGPRVTMQGAHLQATLTIPLRVQLRFPFCESFYFHSSGNVLEGRHPELFSSFQFCAHTPIHIESCGGLNKNGPHLNAWSPLGTVQDGSGVAFLEEVSLGVGFVISLPRGCPAHLPAAMSST